MPLVLVWVRANVTVSVKSKAQLTPLEPASHQSCMEVTVSPPVSVPVRAVQVTSICELDEEAPFTIAVGGARGATLTRSPAVLTAEYAPQPTEF
jgi:hypothetical protein